MVGWDMSERKQQTTKDELLENDRICYELLKRMPEDLNWLNWQQHLLKHLTDWYEF